MKAIIMAGGEGTRLRPLTCNVPKPMMRLIDRPVMEYSLELLVRHGVTEAAATLGYLPERISDHFGDGEKFGIKLNYYIERTPLGTAGGVKQAEEFLDETFCVLSGDGVTDCDLTKALNFHREKGAKATIVLAHAADPMAYGLVMTAPDGRITRFLEKPAWGEVVSDLVNTGIYILEPEILSLVDKTPCDFGRDIFPLMAGMGCLYGYATDGYWCDIGDIASYMAVTRDAFDGKIDLEGLKGLSGIHIDPSANVDTTAELIAPCWIGPGCTIDKNARIGPYTVAGENTVIGDFAGAKRSIMWSGAALGEGAQARGCVLALDAKMNACARAFEGCVLGAGAVMGVDSELAPGVSLWPGKSLPSAVLCNSNIIWGAQNSASRFHEGAIFVSSPDEALRAAEACAVCLQPREVLLGRAPSTVAGAIWHSVAASLMAHSASVIDAGVCTEPQLRYAMSLMKADAAMLAASDRIIPLNKSACHLSDREQRTVNALIARQDFPRPFSGITHPVTASGRSEHAYTAMLAAAFTADASLCPPVAVHSSNQYLLSLAESAFTRAGVMARCEWEEELMELGPGEIGVWLDDEGSHAQFAHEGGMLTAAQNELLMAWTALEAGETQLCAGPRSTRGLNELADRYAALMTRLPGTHAPSEQALVEKSLLQFRLHTDGLYFAISALSALTCASLTLPCWLSTMPRMHRSERTLPLPDAKRGAVLRTLMEQESAFEAENGLNIDRKNAFAWICPDDEKPECRIITESMSMETANELCDFCENALRRAAEEHET